MAQDMLVPLMLMNSMGGNSGNMLVPLMLMNSASGNAGNMIKNQKRLFAFMFGKMIAENEGLEGIKAANLGVTNMTLEASTSPWFSLLLTQRIAQSEAAADQKQSDIYHDLDMDHEILKTLDATIADRIGTDETANNPASGLYEKANEIRTGTTEAKDAAVEAKIAGEAAKSASEAAKTASEAAKNGVEVVSLSLGDKGESADLHGKVDAISLSLGEENLSAGTASGLYQKANQAVEAISSAETAICEKIGEEDPTSGEASGLYEKTKAIADSVTAVNTAIGAGNDVINTISQSIGDIDDLGDLHTKVTAVSQSLGDKGESSALHVKTDELQTSIGTDGAKNIPASGLYAKANKTVEEVDQAIRSAETAICEKIGVDGSDNADLGTGLYEKANLLSLSLGDDEENRNVHSKLDQLIGGIGHVEGRSKKAKTTIHEKLDHIVKLLEAKN